MKTPADRLLELEQEQNRIRMAAELEQSRPPADLEQAARIRTGLNHPDEDSPDRQAPYYDATAGRIILRNKEQ